MPIRFATQAAMAATDTTAYTDFTLAETEDQHLLWILDKTSVATVGTEDTNSVASAGAKDYIILNDVIFDWNGSAPA